MKRVVKERTRNVTRLNLETFSIYFEFWGLCVFVFHFRCRQSSETDLLENRILLQRVQKVMVCGLFLVDFDPFCVVQRFKVRCL